MKESAGKQSLNKYNVYFKILYKNEDYSTLNICKGDYINTTRLKYSLWHEIHNDKVKGCLTGFLRLRTNLIPPFLFLISYSAKFWM